MCKRLTFISKNKDQIKKSNEKNRLKRKYNLTEEQLQEMKSSQGFRCAICKSCDSLVVDHNHETGKIRQMLCNSCNSLLGFAQESEEILTRAIRYLRLHNL